MRSIRNTLLIAVTATIVLTTLLVGILSYAETTHEVEELFDAELAQMTRVLQGLLRHRTDRGSLAELQQTLRDFDTQALSQPLPDQDNDEFFEGLPGHRYEMKIAFQMWKHQDEELVTAHPGVLPLPREFREGFDWTRSAEHNWRTFTLYDPENEFWLRAAQREDIRRELTDELSRSMLWPWLWIVPFLLASIFAIITWGFRPLKQIEQRVRALRPEQLETIEIKRTPAEVRGLVTALNQLLIHLREAMAREKRFTADAAHELRTPLAALKLDLQTAMEQPRPKLAPLLSSVERMTRLAEQLLMLSRLDPQHQLEMAEQDFRPVAEAVLAELAPHSFERDIEFVLHAPAQFRLKGDASLLAVLLRNLVHNAILYSPRGTQVTVHLAESAHHREIRVEDQGAGIEPEDRERVLKRFVRGDHPAETGSGLGLSIVQRIVELHGAHLELRDLSDGQRGLCVSVTFDR
ncbi:MAG: ATP-binding protein [Gammaproteobacteria bacterium]|nr:ATP-binding protein [Gammaproteobacteria bacterium]